MNIVKDESKLKSFKDYYFVLSEVLGQNAETMQKAMSEYIFNEKLLQDTENKELTDKEYQSLISVLISDKNNDTILMNKIINDIKFANITNSQNKNNKIISINNMSLHDCLQNTEKEIITNYLISSNNKKDAAKKLGISTNTLWRKIKEHNISI